MTRNASPEEHRPAANGATDPGGGEPGVGGGSGDRLRHDWRVEEVEALFATSLPDLVFRAQSVHRRHFDPNQVQLSTLLSIKTGGCPEDCAYCPQSARYRTGVAAEALLDVEAVVESARAARDGGATRFCMGAAWRSPKQRDLERVCEMVRRVRALGMETCVTLGMLSADQAEQLQRAGLDYYNHNLDTSEAYYGEIITTRSYRHRLETLQHVRAAGIRVCCGGILGMGEDLRDRAALFVTLANLPEHPESVPINTLVQVEGTPLHGRAPVDPLDLVRAVAVARLMMPRSVVRLSAGRDALSDEAQALCFLAGANSIFLGPRLLTTGNPERERDDRLFTRLGLRSAATASASRQARARSEAKPSEVKQPG